MRNGKPLTVNAASYNAAADRKKTTEQIVALKKQGINTVCTDYPQPVWFYDICDQQGMYVIDQPNINSSDEGGNRAGAISNNPEWLDSFLARTEAMYTRVQNHSCVIGWSLGGSVGNGFNMYRAYLRLKELEVERAVIFNEAAGEWNTDTLPVTKAEGAEVLSRPVPRSGSRR